MGLLPASAVVDGSITLDGEELIGLDDARMAKVRGKRIAMVFQDPLSALTPVYTVGDQLAEAIRIQNDVSRQAARERSVELLEARRHPARRRPRRRLPARVLGRHAPARDDRDGDRERPRRDHRRRADHRAGRDDPGPGPRGPAHRARAHGRGDRDDHPRPQRHRRLRRPRGRDVRRAHRRDRDGRRGLLQPRMPYTMGLLGAIPRADESGDRPLVADRRHAALARRPAGGLPVRAALPARDRHLPRGRAGADRGRQPEPPVRVPPRARRSRRAAGGRPTFPAAGARPRPRSRGSRAPSARSSSRPATSSATIRC